MAETVLTLFRRTALRLGDQTCFHYKKGQAWQKLSWAEAEDQVRRLSLGLAALGVKPGETVGLISQTRLEWTLLDLAIQACQAITVPIYPTLSPDQTAYIVEDAKIRVLILENSESAERLKGIIKNLPKQFIFIDSVQELFDKGRGLPVNRYDENLRQIKPADTATVVYTSGTTGPPKGVILTHRNLLAEVEGLQQVFPFGPDQIGLMCLPLAHVIARAMQFFALAQGCQTAFAENLEKLPQNLTEIRPHFMAVVPRLLEKSHEKVQERLAKATPLLKMFFCKFWLARKVRAGFGGRLKWIISGGAPLSEAIARFFHRMGILVLEGYGLTETFAAVTINRPDDFRLGTIGKPLEGIRVKINEEGEICVKGDTVFSGYLGLKEETEKVFDGEGWFLTGDVGEFTKEGFLKITDRKKDIIVTASGKNIAPQHIEGRLAQSPYINQAFVYGDRQRFLSALITLNWTAVAQFARKEGVVPRPAEDWAQNEKIVELIQAEIDAINRSLSRFETIKKFAILPRNFSMESGELTPTLKVKRKVVAERYKDVLEKFYQS